MNVDETVALRALNDVVHTAATMAAVDGILRRLVRQLAASADVMAWDVVPLDLFGGALPRDIRSCWVFVLRGGANTTPERHPNSRQRSLSLSGSGTFELRERGDWQAYPLESVGTIPDRRWVSIPPSTWHRLFVGPEPWGVLSFHTVVPEELVEEKPVNPDDLDGATHGERYAGRR
jgi:hypothetical protein